MKWQILRIFYLFLSGLVLLFINLRVIRTETLNSRELASPTTISLKHSHKLDSETDEDFEPPSGWSKEIIEN